MTVTSDGCESTVGADDVSTSQSVLIWPMSMKPLFVIGFSQGSDRERICGADGNCFFCDLANLETGITRADRMSSSSSVSVDESLSSLIKRFGGLQCSQLTHTPMH